MSRSLFNAMQRAATRLDVKFSEPCCSDWKGESPLVESLEHFRTVNRMTARRCSSVNAQPPLFSIVNTGPPLTARSRLGAERPMGAQSNASGDITARDTREMREQYDGDHQETEQTAISLDSDSVNMQPRGQKSL